MKTSSSQPSGRRFPPLWVWVIMALCLAAILAVRAYAPSFDRATANILTLVLGFIASATLLTWFSFLSGYARLLRLGTLLVVCLAVLAMIAVLRIEHVSGELIPTFSFRWAKRPDQLLEKPAVTTARQDVDLSTTTAHDFPQFLGPDRNLRLSDVRLVRQWDQQPPQTLWRQPIGAGWSAFSVVNGFAVTLEQRGDQELVTCYEVMTGTLRWSHAIEGRHSTIMGGVGPRSTPTIADGNVYALGATGILRCLDGATGALQWSVNLLDRYGLTPDEDLQEIAWGRAASPLIVDDLVVVPAGGPSDGPHVSLVAFAKDTGEVVWEGGDSQISYSSPTLGTFAGKRQIVIVNESSVAGHDPHTGKELWQYSWPGGSSSNANTSQAVPLDSDQFFVSKGYGGGAALVRVEHDGEQWTTEELWHNHSVLRTKFTNVVIQDGYVYGLSDGILECVRLRDGQRQWRKGRYGHGQILGVGDLLLVLSESGELLMVEASPERHSELASLQALDGKTWNNLCLYGPYLLVRNAEQAACYKLPIARSASDSTTAADQATAMAGKSRGLEQ